jgi:glycolate oxidase FAD binding subunit
LPTSVPELLAHVEHLAAEQGAAYTVTGRAALGILFVRIGGSASRQAEVVAALRRDATAKRGSAVLLSAPADIQKRLGVWGSNGDAVPVMRAVKARFDPQGTLNPGREPWEPA